MWISLLFIISTLRQPHLIYFHKLKCIRLLESFYNMDMFKKVFLLLFNSKMPWVCMYIYTRVCVLFQWQKWAKLYQPVFILLSQFGSPCPEHLNSPTFTFNPGHHTTIKGAGLSLQDQGEHPPYISSYLGYQEQDLLFPFSLQIGKRETYRVDFISLATPESPNLERTNVTDRPSKIANAHHSNSKKLATSRDLQPQYQTTSSWLI